MSVQEMRCSAPLFLDEWLREDIIKSAPGEHVEKMHGLPTRRLIYYGVACRLAATIEHVMQNSLHYSRKLAKNPGRNAAERAVSELKRSAALCLNSKSKSYATIEGQIRNILISLPFTYPEDLLKEPESFLSVSHNEVEGLISQQSSGTTGQSCGEYKRIFCTREDQEKTIEFFACGMRYMIDPARGDRVALLLTAGGRGEGSLARLFSTAMNRLGTPCLAPQNTADETALLSQLAAFGPTCIVGTPRQVISLFRSSEAGEQIARIKAKLKNILLSGDRISSATNELLAAELEAEVFTHYGMVESGLGTAVECNRKRGCHYREADFIIEIITSDGISYPLPQNLRETIYIDPDDIDGGQVYGPTPWGEITVTSLTRRGSPLIRYRTGDFGQIVINRCACGSGIWRLDVRGRMGDYVELPPRPEDAAPPHIVHSNFDRTLYSLPWVKDYQVIAHTGKNGNTHALAVAVLLNGIAPADDAEAAQALKQALSPVTARACAHGVDIFISLERAREKFARSFPYSLKRSFLRSAEPLDPALHIPARDA